jgi:hypothetical protein
MATVMKNTRNAVALGREPVINNKPVTHVSWETGDVAHQGDLIFVCISKLPKSAKLRRNRQLAEGQTQGSRHVLTAGKAYNADSLEVVKAIKAAIPECDVAEKYIGPIITGLGAHVDHPEHGPHTFAPDCVTAVVYQRSLDNEEREQIVQD